MTKIGKQIQQAAFERLCDALHLDNKLDMTYVLSIAATRLNRYEKEMSHPPIKKMIDKRREELTDKFIRGM